MELPFAVESPAAAANLESSQHSESGSLVTASSQGSFLDASNDDNLPFVPNTPQDVVLPQHQEQQGQLVVIPAASDAKDAGYENPENDFTYVNVTEIDADEDDEDLAISSNQKRGDVLAVLLGEMQQNEGSPLLVSERNIPRQRISFSLVGPTSLTSRIYSFELCRTTPNTPTKWR